MNIIKTYGILSSLVKDIEPESVKQSHPLSASDATKSISKHEEFNSGKKAIKSGAMKKTKSFSKKRGTSKVINLCHKFIKL